MSDQKGKRLPTADRYKFVVSNVQATAHAAAHPDGEYVKWSEYEELQRQLGEANEALAACQSQAGPCIKDAERYRWLRCRIPVTAIHCRGAPIRIMPADSVASEHEAYAVEVDAAIDAARGGGK